MLALAVTIGLIPHGSLYPFAFYSSLDPPKRVEDLLATWNQPSSSLGDLLANILMYLPLWPLCCQSRCRGCRRWCASLPASWPERSCPVSLELLRRYDLGRVSAMSDGWPTLKFIGAIHRRNSGLTVLSTNFSLLEFQNLRQPLRSRLFPLLLARLPVVSVHCAVIDLHKYWPCSPRPLLRGPGPEFGDLLRHGASWLAVGALLESVWGATPQGALLPVLPLRWPRFSARASGSRISSCHGRKS